jgi:hypothetical protein
MTTSHRPAAALLLLVTVAGCAASFEMQVPQDFVVLEDKSDAYDQRATNAHGVVIAVRAVDNDPKGNTTFYVDAIQNRVRALGGYALVERTVVKAATGEEGTQLRFGRDQHGAAHTYWVTVFVTEKRVYVIEAGGRRELFDEALQPVEKAIAAFRIK